MTAPPPPPALENLPAGTVLVAGLGTATILADFDWETYSEAGWVWSEDAAKWEKPPGTPPSKTGGLPVCGAAVYSEHPTTEVLSLAYDLKDGRGRRHWKPGDAPPLDLFAHIAAGGLLEAWNVAFESWIWDNVAVPRMGWPPLPAGQLRCAMAKARANALPGKLEEAGKVAAIAHGKDADGARLIKKFSIPRTPTKNDPRRRIRLADDPADAQKLFAYNVSDICAEAEISAKTPDLSPDELAFWQLDQRINRRGVALDVPAVGNCIAIIEQAFEKYNAELRALTGGAVTHASQLPSLKDWSATRGLILHRLREEDLDELLGRKDLPADVYRALEIRALIGSASIKKLYAMRNQLTSAGRVHDLFVYHAARTGRAGGAEVQPHNMPRDGAEVFRCLNVICSHWFGASLMACPWCGTVRPPPDATNKKTLPKEWNAEAFEDAFSVIATRSLECVELFFGDACALIIGCLRALFVASPGHDYIASDFSAIEGVVTAALAGEQWRLETFARGDDIYLANAAKMTGNTLEFYVRYKLETGKHHWHRQPFGKVAELSSGFGGWIGAWKEFGADEFFSDDEIKQQILKWRAASPNIVELWGGQFRGLPWNADYRAELFGLEGAAIQAVLNPGKTFTYRANHPLAAPISYLVYGDILYCILPSGRSLKYHSPRITSGSQGIHKDGLSLTFEGWNTNPKNGPVGWITMKTYGGKLTENVVQAVARDILRDAMLASDRENYPTVLHVHDEIVAEVPQGFGSVEEFEAIMSTLPPWCAGWPLKAKGGWRGRRYRKD